MDKGIIIGAEHESSVMSNLPFVTFRHARSVRISRVTGAHTLTDVTVPFVSASHLAFSSGSWPSTRGGLLRVALPAPGFLRTCPRDSPSHSRRVRSNWGRTNNECGGQQPSVCHRFFGSFRCCSGRGSRMCAQNGNDALAPSVRHRRRPEGIV